MDDMHIYDSPKAKHEILSEDGYYSEGDANDQIKQSFEDSPTRKNSKMLVGND